MGLAGEGLGTGNEGKAMARRDAPPDHASGGWSCLLNLLRDPFPPS